MVNRILAALVAVTLVSCASGSGSLRVAHDAELSQNYDIAVAEYTLLPGKILFTHTEVPEGHKGKGIGTTLIRFALDTAREGGLRVVPICPFFAAYMAKHADVQDLLDPVWRKKIGLH